MPESPLEEYFKSKEKKWESLCRRCGSCCGAFDDPCMHLRKDGKEQYYCEIYPDRLGTRKTVGGEEFDCVSINEVIRGSWKKDWLCAYKKLPLRLLL